MTEPGWNDHMCARYLFAWLIGRLSAWLARLVWRSVAAHRRRRTGEVIDSLRRLLP